MTVIKLPELFEGGWQHALILTYGLNALFFENAIMSMLGTSCRNRIILADGRRYLDACHGYADNNLVRYLNQRYVAEGIYTRHAAHAKLILLTHPERGRLLVGSGNLDLSGYASGGEQFTRYDWLPQEQATLPAFQTAWELIRYLADTDLISETARSQLLHLENDCAWINAPMLSNWRPIRHNLYESFLAQFVAAINGELVEELIIMTPFYDQQAYALQQMLVQLEPQKVTVIVQVNRTSVDPASLKAVLASVPCGIQMMSVTDPSDKHSPYYHTKLYLAKLPDRAVCLQGSPNLSRRAMLWTVQDGRGNIELANLLIGSRDDFDILFDEVLLTPITLDETDLGLRYLSDTTIDTESGRPYRLLGGDWEGERLTLKFDGELPSLEYAYLNIDDQLYPLRVTAFTPPNIEVQLPEMAVNQLQRSAPLRLQWGEDEQSEQSNPIFVCNLASLKAELATSFTETKPEKFGGLELEDAELELLISDLESHMVLDRRSIWQLASRQTTRTTNNSDEDAPSLSYADIDYDLLRTHPKMRQYLELGYSSNRSRSRLQIILSSITDHFQGLIDIALSGKARIDVALPEELGTSEAESEAEAEAEEEEKERQHYSIKRRLCNVFKHFICRYLKGIQSPDFQEMAGYEVMGHNYIIFSHLLWCLFQKEFFQDEQEFILEAMIQTWHFFWGSETDKGYFDSLEPTQQTKIRQWLHDYHGEAYVLASLYWGEYITLRENRLRRDLRDVWYHLLLTTPFSITNSEIEDTWILVAELNRYEPPRPSRIFKSLSRLANFKSDDEFKRLLENKYGKGQFNIEPSVTIYSEGIGRSIQTTCLILLAPTALKNATEAQTLLQDWIQSEKRNYYRVVSPNLQQAERLAFYDARAGEGLFYDRTTGEEIVFRNLVAQSPAWKEELDKLLQMADRVDNEMSFGMQPVWEQESRVDK